MTRTWYDKFLSALTAAYWTVVVVACVAIIPLFITYFVKYD